MAAIQGWESSHPKTSGCTLSVYWNRSLKRCLWISRYTSTRLSSPCTVTYWSPLLSSVSRSKSLSLVSIFTAFSFFFFKHEADNCVMRIEKKVGGGVAFSMRPIVLLPACFPGRVFAVHIAATYAGKCNHRLHQL